MNISSYIDHTVLKPVTVLADIEKLCKEAMEYHFAAVCVPPLYVKAARQLLYDSGVKVATVIGFPFGYSAIEAKIAEIVLAIVDGAEELDVVVNISAVKNGDWQFLANEINAILPIIRNSNKTVKIIIESGVLTDDEIIKCCELYGAAGVDYLKTSTGYAKEGASVKAVQLMRKHLPLPVKIKASGGIRTYAFAKELIDAGASRLGCSAGVEILRQAVE
ncbi:MAG: deoxyribose-phosphate aldolase [Chitinophagaceae bacterium]|nr:deoxyribose-phosphate aldolase [Chitinophagaceae bacterium]